MFHFIVLRSSERFKKMWYLSQSVERSLPFLFLSNDLNCVCTLSGHTKYLASLNKKKNIYSEKKKKKNSFNVEVR